MIQMDCLEIVLIVYWNLLIHQNYCVRAEFPATPRGDKRSIILVNKQLHKYQSIMVFFFHPFSLSPQLLMSAATPASSCCESGRPVVTDPHTGQAVCCSPLDNRATALLHSRVAGLPALYSSPYATDQGFVHFAADPSAFYSPLVSINHCIKHSMPLHKSTCFNEYSMRKSYLRKNDCVVSIDNYFLCIDLNKPHFYFSNFIVISWLFCKKYFIFLNLGLWLGTFLL